jgi:hypothetical protein
MFGWLVGRLVVKILQSVIAGSLALHTQYDNLYSKDLLKDPFGILRRYDQILL